MELQDTLQEKCDARMFVKLPGKLKSDFAKEARRDKVSGSKVVRALMQKYVQDGKDKRGKGKSDGHQG